MENPQELIEQLKKELLHSRQQFQDIFDNIGAAIWSFDKHTLMLTVSAGFEQVYGYSRQEFYSNPNLWRDVVYSQDLHLLHEHIDKLNSGQSNAFEHRIITKNGALKWVHCICTPVMDSHNNVLKINGVALDICEKKAANAELEQNRLMLQNILNTVDAGIWSYSNQSKKIDYISEGLFKITGYPSGTFIDGKDWEQIIHVDDLPIYHKISACVYAGLSDISEYRIIHANGDIRWVQNRVIPTVDESQHLNRLDGVMIDITSRKIMEQALQRSQQRFKSLIEYNPDLICELDLKGNILAANPAAETMTGQLIFNNDKTISWTDIFGSAGIQLKTDYIERTKRKQPQSYQMTSRHKNGKLIHWEMKNVPIYEKNEMVGMFAICKDITSKKRIQKALAQSVAQYTFIADNMTDLMGALDINGRFRYASPSHRRVLGFDDGKMVGTSAFDYVHSADLDYAQEQFSQMLRSKANLTFRFRLNHAEGYPVYVDCLSTPVVGEDGKVQTVIYVCRDITENVRIEKALYDSEERYRRLIELSPQFMATQRDKKFIYINDAGVKLLGADSADEVIGKSIFDIIHPDDLDIAHKRAHSVAEKKYLEKKEYKIIRLDGQIIEVESTAIFDEQSQSTLILFNDITERKEMERVIRESEQRYRRLVELSPVAIADHKDGVIRYVNPTGMKLVGAEREQDIIGTPLLDWIHPNEREMASARVEYTMLNGYSAPEEYKIVRLDGETVDIRVTSIYDSQSESIELVFEDITARKQAQQALLESEELNRRLIELSPEAIVFHDDFEYLYVNPAGIALFGATSINDLMGRSIFDIIHPDYKEKVSLRLARIYEQMTTSPFVEQKLVILDGTTIDVEVIATSIPYKGKHAGLTIMRNITERKQMEKEREIAEQTIREREERYSRLQTSLDRFSNDLFGVMKVSEMERRLISEVRNEFQVDHVSVIEIDQKNDLVIKRDNRGIPKQSILEDILRLDIKQLPLCEIIDTPSGYFSKIGEIRGGSYFLCIGEKSSHLGINSKRVWLKTIVRYVSVLYENFHFIEDLTKELEHIASQKVAPSWLLRLLFNLSENERKRLSQDLHDAALQEQIVWYRKLDQLSSDLSVSNELRVQIGQIAQGLLDVIYHIRLTCNDLRPPLLKEQGLVFSLEELFEFIQLRTNYSITFDNTNFIHPLNDDQLISLYRIVQELLANAEKHSNASQVSITLSSSPREIQLTYKDNGVGMDLNTMEDSFHSMGMYGMKERVRSLDGQMDIQSSLNNGMCIVVTIPVHLRNWNLNG